MMGVDIVYILVGFISSLIIVGSAIWASRKHTAKAKPPQVSAPPPPSTETLIRGVPANPITEDVVMPSGEIRCSNCGILNPPLSRFCRGCGKKIEP
jgi:hypothetical protein